MKEITITLPDRDAGKFVAQLMDMSVTFTVRTTVAQDPLVLAAIEDARQEEPVQARVGEPDPVSVQAGLKGAKTGAPTYERQDRPGKRVQRLTPDGRTSMEVVEAKIATFHGRKFKGRDVTALAEYTGFQPQTLQNQLQILVARGALVKMDRWSYRAVEDKRASPLPNGSSGEPHSEPSLASTTLTEANA